MRISLEQAKVLLEQKQVVAIPTETVYGLAAIMTELEAVELVFALKKRPPHNPLIIHVGKKEDVATFCEELPATFHALTDAFWPGPLTLVLPVNKERVPASVRAHLPTAAFRMPNHPDTLALLQRVPPLVAPSANLSGSPSSTRPEHVEQDFGRDFPVLDGGACQQGVESTVLAQVNGVWQIARLGALAPECFLPILGYKPALAAKQEDSPICPGQLLQHYAPKARLVLSTIPYASCPHKLPVVLGFTRREYPGAKKLFCLGSTDDPAQICHHLYERLRELDREGILEAWVDMDMPQDGLWQTILERLSRAASR